MKEQKINPDTFTSSEKRPERPDFFDRLFAVVEYLDIKRKRNGKNSTVP